MRQYKTSIDTFCCCYLVSFKQDNYVQDEILKETILDESIQDFLNFSHTAKCWSCLDKALILNDSYGIGWLKFYTIVKLVICVHVWFYEMAYIQGNMSIKKHLW